CTRGEDYDVVFAYW
nr:immunoglobulin heavy chain junction region [Mus musculus]